MKLSGLLTIAVLESVVTFLYVEAFNPERDVEFILRMKDQQTDDDQIYSLANREAIKERAFNPGRPTTFLIHGFMEDRNINHHIALRR